MELQTPKNGVIGTDMPVRDAALKVTGQFKYVGDMTLPHMLHAKVVVGVAIVTSIRLSIS